MAGAQQSPRKQAGRLRMRSIGAGMVAAFVLVLLIALGSRGFHWFDAALIGYAVATIFATAAVTYKYTFWLARPPTGRYWRRSWQLFLSYANFRRYTVLIPAAISLRKRLSVGAACIAGSRTSASSGAWCSPV